MEIKKLRWKDKASDVIRLAEEGKTLQEIGDVYGVSREMIRQVLKKYAPNLPKEHRGIMLRTKKQREQDLSIRFLRTNRESWRIGDDDLARAMAFAFARKRQNTRHAGKWDWDLLPSDLEWPTHCPILGMELDWFADKRQENSPSFDRIDTSKGYLKGNVVICSWRANRIKNDGSSEEHSKISDFLKKYNI